MFNASSSSRLSDVVPGRQSLDLMVGLAAGHRYLGCALLIQGEPLHLWTHRLQSVGPEHAHPPTTLDRLLASHRQAVVAVAIDPEAPTPRAGANERLREVLGWRQNLVVEVTRPEMAEALGLGAATSVAIRKFVVRRYPVLAAYFLTARRYRTESERYWEDAILATAAALTVYCRMTRPDNPA